MSVKKIKKKGPRPGVESRGRPKVDASLRKDNIVACGFTTSELEEVTRAAYKLGVSRSRFLAEAGLKRSARIKLKVAAKK